MRRKRSLRSVASSRPSAPPRSSRSLPSFAFAAALVMAALASAAQGCGSSDAPSSGGFVPSPAGTNGNDIPEPDAGPLQGLTSISVSPATASLTAGDAVTTQAFKAIGTFADGTTRDVTSLVAWNASPPSILAANGATATPTGGGGGDGAMSALSGPITGTAKIHVAYVKSIVTGGAPTNAAALFAGPADAARNPSLLYPLDGALFPPNLDPMEVQWIPAPGTTLFDVHFSGPSLDVHVFTQCAPIANGCGLKLDAATWSALTTTLAGADPASITVRGTDTSGGAVGSSAAASVQLAAEGVRGGLYYFNTRGQQLPDGGSENAGIFRWDFEQGAGGEFFTQGACAGCHALSRDGTKMLAPYCTPGDVRGCGRPLQLAVVDVATKKFVTPPYPVGDSDTQAWAPDGKFYVTNPTCASIPSDPRQGCSSWRGGELDLIDASSNALVTKVPTGAAAQFPSFSNDGKHLVYARGAQYFGPLSMSGSSLFTIDFDPTKAAAQMFGAETPLLPSQNGENDYYPSYSPDDAWVLFTRSKCDPGDDPSLCDTYDDPSARAMVMPAGGGAPIDLARANGKGKLDDSWARWSPFQGAYKGGQVLWLTFSSVRDYGLRVVDPAGNHAQHVRQLWIVGFDPQRAKQGLDPSFAPVWLPFQDAASSNHIAQWTTKVVGPVK